MKYDYLDEETGEKIKQEALQLHYIPVNHFSGLAPYLREKIRRDADRILKEYNEKFVKRQLNPNNGHRYLPYIV